MECAECQRLQRERDRKKFAYTMAVKIIKNNPVGDAAKCRLLQKITLEKRIDLETAESDLAWHQDMHALKRAMQAGSAV